MQKMPGPMEYWMFSTTNNKDGGEQQSVSGGVMERQMPRQSITNYISVKSVDE